MLVHLIAVLRDDCGSGVPATLCETRNPAIASVPTFIWCLPDYKALVCLCTSLKL